MVNSKTYSQKPSEITREWHLIDATELPLGRLSTVIAQLLTGKGKPTYTPHMDAGDYVVVINAKDVPVTGDKELQKIYYRHSGFPGGIKDARLEEVREKFPERIIEASVRGMLPKNKLQADRMARLKVFPGAEHAHTAQTPKKVEVK
ncbi:50S ribosomal protein L13 [Candidatus Mycosynbacter amalyticus]|uniref:Large ribosomal subunit protein uL13 n=1 Tax=Candidatus Mycosynbacter amalyticus TaxID=2665156 RepID=A0A857MNF9_9BACT|nr:50S ribosomal protein L13 [Candidatus Mycosynbacter amalyticus]QHN42809.1 50S ribosomal protein L13 [Candidatus Mycosynbacter amalyticus]